MDNKEIYFSPQNPKIHCNGENLEEVSTFEYLGSVMTSDGKIGTEIANKTKKSINIYYALNKTIFGRKEVNQITKTLIYNSITVPTLTHGSKTIETLRKQVDSS